MRVCQEKVPLAGRNRRIFEELREEGVIGAQQEVDVAEILQAAVAEALEVLNWSVETADTEEQEEIDELMNETWSESESEEESSETEEEEEPMFWEGIVEV